LHSGQNTIMFPNGNMDSSKLGQVVRRERKAQKLRQAELAAASGVGIRFIVDLEAGKPTLQLEKVLHVLATLGCNVIIIPPEGAPPASHP
jgi:y4mF family transcriptional regulator